jgi:hypothetical protein
MELETNTTRQRAVSPVSVGLVAAAAVAAYFLYAAIGPLLRFANFKAPSAAVIGAVAVASGVLATLISVTLPSRRRAALVVLAVTGVMFVIEGGLTLPWVAALRQLPLTEEQRYWAYWGPGGGVVGSLPACAALLAVGTFTFRIPLREQWGGRLRMSARDWLYGGGLAAGLSGIAIAGAWATGAGRVAWEPHWAGHGVNLFSNLYEEVLARSLVLQVHQNVASSGEPVYGQVGAILVSRNHPGKSHAVYEELPESHPDTIDRGVDQLAIRCFGAKPLRVRAV